MSSRKNLKKAINNIAEELFFESLCYSCQVPKEDVAQTTDILSQINNMQNEFLKRVNSTDGKENPKVVKQYYKKLKDDLNESISRIISQLNRLNDKISKNAKTEN